MCFCVRACVCGWNTAALLLYSYIDECVLITAERARVVHKDAAGGIPESLDNQMDPFLPKEDSKLNVLLRAPHAGIVPCDGRAEPGELRLRLSADGTSLQLAQLILGQDLLYLSVAICSSMLQIKREILLTLRSFCVLHMAQVLIQLARVPATEPDDEGLHINGVCSGGCAKARDDTDDLPGCTKEEHVEMQLSLELLMDPLSALAGVDLVLS